MKTKTIFFGTPMFAVPILEMLLTHPNIELVCVVAQPDKPVGRKKVMTPPPTKELGIRNKIEVFQPTTLKTEEAVQTIKNYQPELIVLAAYGKIIPENILNLPKFKCLNVHPSALPKYRGASPIQFALLNGESKTAVTMMLMEPTLDTGPILAQEEIAIDPEETYPQLADRLANISAKLLSKVLPDWLEGKITQKPQDASQATFTKILTKEDGKIDWNKTAEQIHNQIRAFTPWPSTYTTLNGKLLKILKAKPFQTTEIRGTPGIIYYQNNKQLLISCSEKTVLEVLELQPEGKKAMSAADFMRGYPNLAYVVLS